MIKLQQLLDDGYNFFTGVPDSGLKPFINEILESGVKLGVSSRGSGNVSEGGKVSDFEIVTVDIVAQPSAPDAYPDPIYEKLQHYKKGGSLMELAEAVRHDKKAQKHLTKGIVGFIDSLKI